MQFTPAGRPVSSQSHGPNAPEIRKVLGIDPEVREARLSRRFVRFMAIAALALSATAALSAAAANTDVKTGSKPVPVSASAPARPISTPIRLAYLYKPGDVRKYQVTAFFNGHVPQFGEVPVHLMIVMDYATTVKKVTDKGAVVEFNVENASVNLFEEEPNPDGKIDMSKGAELPLPLAQVQKTLNATATFRPNGVVTDIQGGDSSSVKIDLGIDLRKLFLVTAPIAFAEKPVRSGDTWSFDDGLLGNKQGKTSYTGKLDTVAGSAKHIVATASQTAESVVDSKLDKEGNSTDKPDAAVGSLVGKVTLTGTMQFDGTNDAGSAAPATAEGRLTTGKMAMTVDLKRTLPDADKPGTQKIDTIDIKARLIVKPAIAVKKDLPSTGATTLSSSTTTKPKSPKSAKKSGKP